MLPHESCINKREERGWERHSFNGGTSHNEDALLNMGQHKGRKFRSVKNSSGNVRHFFNLWESECKQKLNI